MLDHVSLGVSDIDRSRRFYDAALSPLGLVRIVDFGNGRGSDYGAAPGSLGVEFTITRERVVRGPTQGGHVCFRAPTRDGGAPGLRPKYHADYYAARAVAGGARSTRAVLAVAPFYGLTKSWTFTVAPFDSEGTQNLAKL